MIQAQTAPVQRPHFRLMGLARVLPYMFLLATTYSVFAETVDDPYITFRYAANLLAGHGAVFNSGERVEGYTSPLHLLVSVLLLGSAPSVDILFKAKCASVLFAFVMLAQTGTLARRSGLRPGEAIVAQSLVALNINFALAGVNALETTLYGSVLLAALLMFHREIRLARGLASGALLFLATLARPEAFLIVAALAAVRLFWMRRTKLPVLFLTGWLGLIVVPALLAEAVRFDYYGQLLPNTYFAKSQPLFTSLPNGAAYLMRATSPVTINMAGLLHELKQLHLSNLLAFRSLAQKNLRSDLFSFFMQALFWALALAGLWHIKRRILGGISAAVVAAVLLFVLKSGGDWMYGWRFVAPVLPLLAVRQCHAIRVLACRVLACRLTCRSFSAVPARQSAALCGSLAVLLWLASSAKTEHYSWKSANFSTQGTRLLEASQGYGPLWVAAASYVECQPPGTSVAFSEMGYTGYRNLDKYILDTRGLTDRRIAHFPAQFKYSTGVSDRNWYKPGDPLYALLEQRKPGVIISLDSVPPDRVPLGYQHRDTLELPTQGTPPQPAYVFQRISPGNPSVTSAVNL